MIFEKELIENIMPFAHAVNVLELPDGALLLIWYCGAYEGAEDQRLAATVRNSDGMWQSTHVAVDRFVFDGELWSPETAVPVLKSNGDVMLYFFAFPRSRFRLVQDIRSEFVKPHRAGFDCTPHQVELPLWYRDLMETRLFMTCLVDFRAGEIVPMGVGENAIILQGRALRLQTGEWVLPYHLRRGAEMRSARVSAGFLLADADLERWTSGAEIFAEPGCSEPAIVQLSSGDVLCYMRRPGLTRIPPPPAGHVWRAVSHDGCMSFSAPVQTNLRNSDTGCDIYLGRNNRLVVAYNDSYTERFPLSVGLSYDLGKTFSMRDVEMTLGVYAYPKVLQTMDGLWHVFYSHNYAQIGHAWFDEEWAAGGRQVLG